MMNASVNHLKLVAYLLANFYIQCNLLLKKSKTELSNNMWWFSKMLRRYLRGINIGRTFNCESATIAAG